MTEGKHTPGPWAVRPSDSPDEFEVVANDAQDVIGEEPWNIATVHGSVGYERDESPHNARLISAAPELLDGCNALLGLLKLVAGRGDVSPALREVLATNHRVAEARAAIRKATGAS